MVTLTTEMHMLCLMEWQANSIPLETDTSHFPDNYYYLKRSSEKQYILSIDIYADVLF